MIPPRTLLCPGGAVHTGRNTLQVIAQLLIYNYSNTPDAFYGPSPVLPLKNIQTKHEWLFGHLMVSLDVMGVGWETKLRDVYKRHIFRIEKEEINLIIISLNPKIQEKVLHIYELVFKIWCICRTLRAEAFHMWFQEWRIQKISRGFLPTFHLVKFPPPPLLPQKNIFAQLRCCIVYKHWLEWHSIISPDKILFFTYR